MTESISFILVRPEFLGNIGSTCRVMKNFGFSDLRLVEPPHNYKDSQARMMAVGAFDILKRARVFDSLETAIEDIQLAIATSSGRKRSRTLDNLWDLAPEAVRLSASNKIAFVFGHERNGLRDDEMALCDRKVRIESSPDFASLNVSQAAGVVAYALAVATGKYPREPAGAVPELPSAGETGELMEQLDLLLENSGFARSYNKRKVMSELRDALSRMTPTRREADLLRGVLFRLNKMLEPK
ncbi:MAG: TrmJ/YjtD family RNA methyltransferase [Candidatus Melainabacteria bacterium]|nr:TrmJ/YjtD family RNA methyltransferase [Candidatus Melainabacteria bacterium]